MTATTGSAGIDAARDELVEHDGDVRIAQEAIDRERDDLADALDLAELARRTPRAPSRRPPRAAPTAAVLLRDRPSRRRHRRAGCRARRAGARTSRLARPSSIAAIRFFADCSANRSSASSCSQRQREDIGDVVHEPGRRRAARRPSRRGRRCSSGRATRRTRSPRAAAPGSRAGSRTRARPCPPRARAASRTTGTPSALERRARALLGHAEDLRDDLAGLLDQHAIAAAEAEPLRPDPSCGPTRATTVVPDTSTGSSIGDRRDRAGAADVRLEVAQDRRDLARRELVGDRPARKLRRRAERGALREVVDLDDEAVDLVRQLVALVLPLMHRSDQRVPVARRCVVRRDRQAEPADVVERREVAARVARRRRRPRRGSCASAASRPRADPSA